ncbi:tRNA threonylcarbamoyladenosine biosynthesis protein TsaB [Paenibacillus tianmuensis]|uniref:tRNA threonylcarbamoyladenosine biosynthesis protein TsaB n=1 Tax=Paenibacillus tianmuensis TaxID=624147 RepID=A0A1G4SLX2_9BACL|nr:tRNA (adenosine(37)-N6)-threonylcarbamoyltransferase complex dimerization subunit type 1 TsaB [Paenibacillus tianmuensis]SCW69937.1 tRNA threonylcarbamoyladenosine biosynthesis protein TsaB [Paenibacillus tianmuensis]
MIQNTASDSTLYGDGKLMLSVDTSTVSMTTALTRGREILGEITSKAERNHSLYLVPNLQRLMAECGVRPDELSAFAVGVGPGSYTGVRIGVTVAKTFAWTQKLALLGVSTLEALALGGAGSASEFGALQDGEIVRCGALQAMDTLLDAARATGEPTWVVPLIDARRGQAFTALYAASPEGWKCRVPDGIRLTASWTDELLSLGASAETGPGRVIFTGELELHREAIRSFASRWDGSVTEAPHELRARHIAELGQMRWKRGETEDVHGLVPNYTQLAEAEAKLLAKKS